MLNERPEIAVLVMPGLKCYTKIYLLFRNQSKTPRVPITTLGHIFEIVVAYLLEAEHYAER